SLRVLHHSPAWQERQDPQARQLQLRQLQLPQLQLPQLQWPQLQLPQLQERQWPHPQAGAAPVSPSPPS
ncbi:MAG TPA: hypothetical protein VFH51_10595, partial [Myxococcota bacterium]|nr:hypothetical protein [Myxococcota bacterium]